MTDVGTIREVSAVRKRRFGAGSPKSTTGDDCRPSSCWAVRLAVTAVTLVLLALFASHRDGSFVATQLSLLVVGAAFGVAALEVFTRARSARMATEGATPTVVGQYTLGEKLGEGGMGVVYQARHALLDRPAAIKLLHPERARREDVLRFEREVRLTSRLSHPNTISVYDSGRTADGLLYYAMEYLDGQDLQTLVEREGPQPPARVAHWLAQLCAALSEAHAAGVIHRDIKPANVVVCERGGEKDVVKLLDFGLSKEFENLSMAVTHSDVQTLVGTPLYLSPEALIAPDTLDGRSDLYAVGALAYFLLTGAPPFPGKGLVEVCAQHLHSTPVPPSQKRGARLPAGLDALVLRCLGKSMDERPASAAALRAELLPFAAARSDERNSSFEAPAALRLVSKARAASGWQLSVPRAEQSLGLCLSACS